MADGVGLRNWEGPPNWVRIRTLETHAAGEPLRIVVDGWPFIPGSTILEKRRFAIEHHDGLRRLLMSEPRGHSEMYGAIVTEPVTSDGDLGVLFMHNEGFSTMCGHGIIAVTMALVETGTFEVDKDSAVVRYDTPAGRVVARANVSEGRVESVSFTNVPSFVYALDQFVDVPGLGKVKYDIAFGGAFYAYCDAHELGIELEGMGWVRLATMGMEIKRAVMATTPMRHPLAEDLGFLYGTIICGHEGSVGEKRSRNVCIFADGQIDRSPTGTGVSGRLALEHARGRLRVGERFTISSVIGSEFVGRILSLTQVGDHAAVVPEIEGRASITGRCDFYLDPRDRFPRGFRVNL